MASPLLTFLVVGAALQFAALCFINRRTAVAVLCGLLPTYLFRLHIPLPGGSRLPTTLLEIMVLSLFLAWFLMDGPKTLNRAALSRWSLPTTLFLTGATIAVFVSPDLRSAIGIWRAFFLEPLLFFVVFTSVIRGPTERRNVLAALGASLALIGVTAVFQKLTGFGIPNPIWQAEATRRVTSFYGYPNAIGLFAAPLTVLMAAWSAALMLHHDQKNRLLSLLPLGAAFLGLLGIVFAVSQGAMIGLLAGLLVLGLLVAPLRKATLVLIIIGSLAVIGLKPLRDEVSLLSSLRDDSGSVRQIVWHESAAMLNDHPVFGAGLAGYQPGLVPYHKATWIEIFMYPHDLFLNFWTETGLIGLAGFLWLLAAFFLDNTALMRTKKNGLLPASLIAAMVAVLVHGLVDVPYFKNDLAILFWMMIGLTATMVSEPMPKKLVDKFKKIADAFHFYVKN